MQSTLNLFDSGYLYITIFIFKRGNTRICRENGNIVGKYRMTPKYSRSVVSFNSRCSSQFGVLPWHSRQPPTRLDFRDKAELRTPSLLDFQQLLLPLPQGGKGQRDFSSKQSSWPFLPLSLTLSLCKYRFH